MKIRYRPDLKDNKSKIFCLYENFPFLSRRSKDLAAVPGSGGHSRHLSGAQQGHRLLKTANAETKLSQEVISIKTRKSMKTLS